MEGDTKLKSRPAIYREFPNNNRVFAAVPE